MAIEVALRESKQRLRSEVKQRLRTLKRDDISTQSEVITNKVLQLPEYKGAARLSIYLSMPNSEAQTRDIVVDALRNNKKVFVPFIHGRKVSSELEMLALASIDDFESLQPDAWGIPSLAAESIGSRENALGGFGTTGLDEAINKGEVGLDLILMPGMAFDMEKRRLGHGKGYYDRYLQKYRNTLESQSSSIKMPHLVGLALCEQVVPLGQSIPTEDSDWALDRIVSPDVD